MPRPKKEQHVKNKHVTFMGIDSKCSPTFERKYQQQVTVGQIYETDITLQ